MKFYSNPIKVLSTLFITSLILLSYSCEEIINVDLNSADPKIVIEGTVTDQPGPYTVTITKTTDYYNPASYPAVSGAQVRIVDDLGFSEQLHETTDGIYQTGTLQKVKDLTKQLGKMKEIEKSDVTSLYTADNIVGTEDGMDVKAFYKKLKAPGKFGINGSRDFTGNDSIHGVIEFLVTVITQVSASHTKGQIFGGMPVNIQVKTYIAVNSKTGQTIDIIKRSIQVEIFG